MTDTINTEAIVRLSEVQPPCVTLHIPTSPTGRERLAGKIRLKNLAAEAEKRLVERGMRPTEARDLLKPATDLVADEHFWEQPLVGFESVDLPRPAGPHGKRRDQPDAGTQLDDDFVPIEQVRD